MHGQAEPMAERPERMDEQREHMDEGRDPMDERRERTDEPGRMAQQPGDRTRSHMAMPDAASYMRRFEAVQAEFIDEPRRAVEKAESLVSEAIDRMMDSLKQELNRSRTRSDGGDETEQLRMAMKRYREILHSFRGSSN
jgi:hypothetical protein